MQIKSITPNTRTIVTGRLSDGSDRHVQQIIEYFIVVEDGGNHYQAVLLTDEVQGIEEAYDNGLFSLIPSTPDERIAHLEDENAMLTLELVDTKIRLEDTERRIDQTVAEQAVVLQELVEKKGGAINGLVRNIKTALRRRSI